VAQKYGAIFLGKVKKSFEPLAIPQKKFWFGKHFLLYSSRI